MRNWKTYLVSVCVAILCVMDLTQAQVRMTREQALSAYFPDKDITRGTAFLTDEEVKTIQTRARAKVESKIVTYYRATASGALVGTAFLETQTVRTMPATFIVVIDPDTTVRACEILAFHEPEDYLPSQRWMDQFAGKGTSDDLYLKRGIHSIAGSTLSAQAISDAVRRLLATYEVVIGSGEIQ